MQETKVSYSEITLPGKPCFLFQDVLKRWSFQKNCTGIWSFLYYWERWYFFFPNIWSYTLDGKWKMIFLKKIHENIIFSSNFLKIWSFQKGPPRHIIFFVLSGKMVFFFPKTWYFFPGQKVRDGLSLKIHGNMRFSVYTYGCYKRGTTPLCQKNQRWSYPAKIHLKVIDVLDWHPGKKLQQFSVLSWRPLQAF